MDDEIIIGIEKKNNSNVGKRKVNKNKLEKKNNKYRNAKNIKKEFKCNKIKIIILLILIFVGLILFCSSSFFNIKEIIVENNEIISSDEIISLSKIEKYTNIFSLNKKESIAKIKENAYIEDVLISRKLPDKIIINVKERIPKYMIQFADSYVYINNQGYMLDISNEKLNLPIILGFITDLSNIQAGNRIELEDLNKMDMIIKITETAKMNEIDNLITKIDVSNEKNFILILESKGKKVYLGDASDLNTKMLYLKSILEATEGSNGEIFLNVDLNTRDAYFRESIN